MNRRSFLKTCGGGIEAQGEASGDGFPLPRAVTLTCYRNQEEVEVIVTDRATISYLFQNLVVA